MSRMIPLPGACSGRESDRRVNRNVVALIGIRRLRQTVLAMRAAVVETVDDASARNP
jgi:hypothetical protein